MQLFILDYGWKDQSVRGNLIDLSAVLLIASAMSQSLSNEELYSTMMKIKYQTPGFESQFSLPAMWPSVTYLTS